MVKREKTRFEKFFSLNQHRKRWGAKKFTADLSEAACKLDEMKAQFIDLGEPVQTYGSSKSLALHLQNLRQEFSGQSELLFYHAKLIVLIRRDWNVAETYRNLKQLWEHEGEFLREHLNLRWLVSACETIADHDDDKATRIIALQGSLIANIVKVYETDYGIRNACELPIDPERVKPLQKELSPLFSGMSYFAVGTDDTLRNLRYRMNKVFAEPIVGPLVQEIFDRMQTEETAFKRMKELHTREQTEWW